jgi:hypothetical protein
MKGKGELVCGINGKYFLNAQVNLSQSKLQIFIFPIFNSKFSLQAEICLALEGHYELFRVLAHLLVQIPDASSTAAQLCQSCLTDRFIFII